MKDSYKFLGPIYKIGCFLVSGNALSRCRISQFANIKAGDKILIAGVGPGDDALYAAQIGAHVTVVDISQTMLKEFSKLISSQKYSGTIRALSLDILHFQEQDQFDYVVANFFLNVFSKEKMKIILKHLIQQAKPGGKIIVSDFAYSKGNFLIKFLQNMYWYCIVSVFWLFAGNAFHKIENYEEVMEDVSLTILSQKHTAFLFIPFFTSLLGEKKT